GLSPRRPGRAVVQGFENVDLGRRGGSEEAELTQVEGMVAGTVRHSRVTAGAKVARRNELGYYPGAGPMPSAITRPHDDDASAHIVIGGSNGDQRVIGAVGDRFLVLRHFRIAIVIHLYIALAHASRRRDIRPVSALRPYDLRIEAETHAVRDAAWKILDVEHPARLTALSRTGVGR